MGFPRCSGEHCCSNVLKQELRSTCRIRGSLAFIDKFPLLKSIGYLLKCPKKVLRVVGKPKIKCSGTHCKFMDSCSALPNFIVIGQFHNHILSPAPPDLINLRYWFWQQTKAGNYLDFFMDCLDHKPYL